MIAMTIVDTNLVLRLQDLNGDAWLEFWDVFGSSIERMVDSIARRCFSQETVQDIRQETLLQVFAEIGKFDVRRGVKFSTWVYAIARHIVSAEMAHRNAQKRGGGVKPVSLNDLALEDAREATPEADFEKQVFRAKVYRALKLVEKRSEFLEFQVFKMKVTPSHGPPGAPAGGRPVKSQDIALVLGISEASVSRYLRRVRERLREVLRDVVREYSFTEEEVDDIRRYRLDASDDILDAALGDICATVEEDRRRCHRVGKPAATLP